MVVLTSLKQARENRMKKKIGCATSTEAYSGSPVCDGHHHGDGPSEIKPQKKIKKT